MNFNNQIRTFHIDKFPSDRIFVYLNEEFHKELFSRIKKYKFKEFNRLFFNNILNKSTFTQWKKRKTDLKIRIKNHFIPLWFILKLSEIFNIPIFEIEKNIVAYKGPSSSAIITNPNFPLREDERLLKIIAHLLGDGHVGGGFGSHLPKGKAHSEYRNFSSELLDQFEKDLSVFGNVPTSKNYKHGSVILPNLIGYTLKNIYKIEFDTFNSRIPKDIFNLPKELIAHFLRAFGDDEGHVYDSSIDYYSNNKELIKDILNLIKQKFPEFKISEIKANTKAGKNIKYSLTIYNGSQKDYLEQIGFDHPKKTEDLIFNIKRVANPKRYKRGEAKKLIKKYLKSNLTPKQISRKIGIRHSTVLGHLKNIRN